MRIVWIPLSLILALLGTGCGTAPLRPVEIDAADVCAQCKMAISEKRYAAELAEPDGGIVKFDNVACLIRYASAHGMKETAGAVWLMDNEGQHWLDARQAFLVQSARIPGPMGDGILAASDPSAADNLAKRFAGARILRFEDLGGR